MRYDSVIICFSFSVSHFCISFSLVSFIPFFMSFRCVVFCFQRNSIPNISWTKHKKEHEEIEMQKIHMNERTVNFPSTYEKKRFFSCTFFMLVMLCQCCFWVCKHYIQTVAYYYCYYYYHFLTISFYLKMTFCSLFLLCLASSKPQCFSLLN